MMGQQRGGQELLFYSFNLEDRIPPNHLLRAIDHHLDQGLNRSGGSVRDGL